jgi:hypothetical protein
MIVANQQANIKNVNGALADTLANIPPAQSTFYLFYATDTQEIYYDNGAWILLGSGGAGTNIYNSDGTLTGNRTLSGANNDLTFIATNDFSIIPNGNLLFNPVNNGNITLDNTFGIGGNIFIQGGINTEISSGGSGKLFFDGNNANIKTQYQSNDIGLKLDFANNEFGIGQYFGNGNGCNIIISDNNNNILASISNYYILNFIPDFLIFGDTNQIFNGTRFIIKEQSNIINTQYQNNDIGLKLDFANQQYIFGNVFNSYGYIQDDINGIIKIGDPLGNFGGYNNLNIDYLNSLIYTQAGGNDIGLKLDFANSIYEIGQLTGGNAVKITFDDTNDRIYTTGISNQVSGLDIYPNLQQFYFGVNSTNNLTHLFINDVAEVAYFANAGFVQGLNLDFANTTYKFGQINGGNETRLEIFDPTGVIETRKPGGVDGLQLNLVNSIYKFGNLTGTNNTYFQIDDLAAFPVQLNGTNLISNTAGGNSGLHLKIKVNGVDYKLRLENP